MRAFDDTDAAIGVPLATVIDRSADKAAVRPFPAVRSSDPLLLVPKMSPG